jgi:hypothetical protein
MAKGGARRMFHTAFLNTHRDSLGLKGRLVEFSFRDARQTGSLVALSPSLATNSSESAQIASVFVPYEGRASGLQPHTELAATVLDWVFGERPQGSILLMRDELVFQHKIDMTARPGRPFAQLCLLDTMKDHADTAFGLGVEFGFLSKVCQDTELPLQPIGFPVLIEANDLRLIAARWLNLCQIIGDNVGAWVDTPLVAYRIAVAEHRLVHDLEPLAQDAKAAETTLQPSQVPLLDLTSPILGAGGELVFDFEATTGTLDLPPSGPVPSMRGRLLLGMIRHLLSPASALDPVRLTDRPMQVSRVREGWVLDRLMLIRGQDEAKVWLNTSGSAIWSLCDGLLSLTEISNELSRIYEAPVEHILPDVWDVVVKLHSAGLIRLNT